jgi:7-cyano-7-deazaguanine synthase
MLASSARVREHRVVEVPFYKTLEGSPSSDMESDLVESGSGVSAAYVPARNIVFFGMAAALAESVGAEFLVSGHNLDDVSRFPDTGRDFVAAMNRVVEVGLKTKGSAPRVYMPLADMTKDQVLRRALSLKVPLELTWSCYSNGDSPCGRCYGCVSRRRAFLSIGVKDTWM